VGNKKSKRQINAYAALRNEGVAVFDIAENLFYAYRIFHFILVWMQK